MKKKTTLAVLATLLGSISAFACTTAIVGKDASESGKVMMWKQRDSSSNPFNHIAHIPAADGHYAYTALFCAGDVDCRKAYAGANEVGFAIANNLSYNLTPDDSSSGNGSLMRMALESCASVDEFEEFLNKLPKPLNCEANFAVTDGEGHGAYFEAGGDIITRYDVPDDGWLVRTNYSISGDPESGNGYARYETADYIMSQHQGLFCPEDLIEGLGRSFYNRTLDNDAYLTGDIVYDEDFIARPSTASSICIEGGEIMWVAIGYTPGSYSVPVWVKAADEIPECLKADKETGKAPAAVFASDIKDHIHHLPRDGKKYIDMERVREYFPTLREYEEKSMQQARVLNKRMAAKGFSREQVASFNAKADMMYAQFTADMKAIMDRQH